jgi:hypothetical protein
MEIVKVRRPDGRFAGRYFNPRPTESSVMFGVCVYFLGFRGCFIIEFYGVCIKMFGVTFQRVLVVWIASLII